MFVLKLSGIQILFKIKIEYKHNMKFKYFDRFMLNKFYITLIKLK